MIRLITSALTKKTVILSKCYGTTTKSTTNKLIIENIRNGIKHLRLYDEIDLLPADLDWDFLLDRKNIEAIEINNLNRKGTGNIHKLVSFIFSLYIFFN